VTKQLAVVEKELRELRDNTKKKIKSDTDFKSYYAVLAGKHKACINELIGTRLMLAEREAQLQRYFNSVISSRELVLIASARCDDLISHAVELETKLDDETPDYPLRTAFLSRGEYDHVVKKIVDRDIKNLAKHEPGSNIGIDINCLIADITALRSLIPIDTVSSVMGKQAHLIAEIRSA
jgi:hypothetical protein